MFGSCLSIPCPIYVEVSSTLPMLNKALSFEFLATCGWLNHSFIALFEMVMPSLNVLPWCSSMAFALKAFSLSVLVSYPNSGKRLPSLSVM